MRSVDNIDNSIRFLTQNEIPCNPFFGGDRREGINSRQIRNGYIFFTFKPRSFFFDGNPGEVAYMLIGTRDEIKKCGFSAILISHKRDI